MICFAGVKSFILIPEELPSLLSVLYGSIPPIKKGKYKNSIVNFSESINSETSVFSDSSQYRTHSDIFKDGLDLELNSKRQKFRENWKNILNQVFFFENFITNMKWQNKEPQLPWVSLEVSLVVKFIFKESLRSALTHAFSYLCLNFQNSSLII